MQFQGHFYWKGLAGAASIDLKAIGRRDCGCVALQFAGQGTHGMCVKGSVASVTRFERPRAVSHQQTLLMPHSSSPLSEPSLKELHTRRAPLGLGQHMRATPLPVAKESLCTFVQFVQLVVWTVGGVGSNRIRALALDAVTDLVQPVKCFLPPKHSAPC